MTSEPGVGSPSAEEPVDRGLTAPQSATSNQNQ
jgi:hypothetical protein